MAKKDFEDRLKNLQKDKEALRNNPGKVIGGIINQEQEAPDFAKIAEELQQIHEEEAHSLNDKHMKMTIYVRTDVAKAFNSLCIKRGDQKKYINQALSDFVARRYKELQAEKAQKKD